MRVFGVNIPDNKRVEVSLTYLYGVGQALSRKALEAAAGGLKKLEDELEAQVVAFALKEGLEAVAGSAFQAEIARGREVGVPKARSELRPAFEAALRETGVWEEVAAPNHQRLASLLSDPTALAPGVRERLAPFLETVERVEAKLKKAKDHE